MSPEHSALVLGTWALAAHDADRQVCATAREAWANAVSVSVSVSSDEKEKDRIAVDDALFAKLCEFVMRTLLDPSGTYLYVNPPQPSAPPPPARGSKGQGRTPSSGNVQRKEREREEDSPRARTEEEDEQEHDRRARIRIGAFGAAEWIFSTSSLHPHTIITMC